MTVLWIVMSWVFILVFETGTYTYNIIKRRHMSTIYLKYECSFYLETAVHYFNIYEVILISQCI